MKSIKLHKLPGERYDPHSFKVYGVSRDGVSVGTVSQDFGGKWEVVNSNFERLSLHSTIKAAVRVAGRVL